MIVLDIETSGLDIGRHGICQIGAIELENPENVFCEDCKIDEQDEILLTAMQVHGRNEAVLRDSTKQSQKQLILNFLKWTNTCKNKIVVGHNIGWDLTFISSKCVRYGLGEEFRKTLSSRSIDIHAIAQLKFKEVNGDFCVNEIGRSNMHFGKVLEFCGIKDERKSVKDNLDVSEEGRVHDALDDVRLSAECYTRIMKGKGLFEEFKEFFIPEYLK
jgi:DNA polymerase III epsilon subunit-like protein